MAGCMHGLYCAHMISYYVQPGCAVRIVCYASMTLYRLCCVHSMECIQVASIVRVQNTVCANAKLLRKERIGVDVGKPVPS